MRQSSDFQVRHHLERQRLQYALAEHARQLWFGDVEVIDEDQGTSGDGVLRTGFHRLVSAVCRGAVGLVLSLEASRLARNGRDWHTLLDYCAIVGCLVGDRRCLYDPAVADDRLFLGMKGNFAEAELALFRQFAELRSVRQVWLWPRREQVEIPVRQLGRGIVWKVPTETGLNALLHNPIYAGAYAFGRRRQETSIENGRKRVRGGILKSGPEEWTVLLRERHEAKRILWSGARQTAAGSARRRPLAEPVTKKFDGLNRRLMPCLWGLLGRHALLGVPGAPGATREGRTGKPQRGRRAAAEVPGKPRPAGRRRERGRERVPGRRCPGWGVGGHFISASGDHFIPAGDRAELSDCL